MTELKDSSTGWTPVPNVLIDRVMPRLTDTEWRVMCVIVRQTFGWQEEEGRKQRDWISSSQFRKRTGRHSSAISRAISVLSGSGLMRVQDSDGTTLKTSAERRRSRSRLYYSLTLDVIGSNSQLRFIRGHERISKSANNNRNTYERKTTTNKLSGDEILG